MGTETLNSDTVCGLMLCRRYCAAKSLVFTLAMIACFILHTVHHLCLFLFLVADVISTLGCLYQPIAIAKP